MNEFISIILYLLSSISFIRSWIIVSPLYIFIYFIFPTKSTPGCRYYPSRDEMGVLNSTANYIPSILILLTTILRKTSQVCQQLSVSCWQDEITLSKLHKSLNLWNIHLHKICYYQSMVRPVLRFKKNKTKSTQIFKLS